MYQSVAPTVPVVSFHSLIQAHPLTLLSTAVVVYGIAALVSRLYSAFYGPLSKFPGPKANAFWGVPWAQTVWKGAEGTEALKLHEKYGPVVRVAPNRLSFVGDAQVWKDIYGFRKASQDEAVKDPLFYAPPINRTAGLFVSDYHTHSRQRKIVSHAFSDKKLKEQEAMLKQWASLLRTKLAEQAHDGDKTDMVKMLNCTTFDVMSDLTFAEPLHMLNNSEYTPWVRTIFDSIRFNASIRAVKSFGRFYKLVLEEAVFRFPAFAKKMRQHWKYTTDRVDRRLSQDPERPDLWSRILEKSTGPEQLSVQEHYSIASLFMIAGTETTATALSGTLYHLIQNPQYIHTLQQELSSAFTSVDDMTLDSLAKLPHLNGTLKEGLRMYPPVPIGLPRVSPKGGMSVGQHFVPEGTSLAVHQLATYRSESNFKHPYSFRPERWLGDDREFATDNRDALEPFSVGPRNCLGKNLAWHELRLLLATVLLHFDFSLCPESQDWTQGQRIFTLWEKPELMCRLSERDV